MDRARLDVVSFHSISKEDNVNLTAPFLLIEIDGEVTLCDGNNSPDPDGFNLSFFNRFWPLLKDDLGSDVC